MRVDDLDLQEPLQFDQVGGILRFAERDDRP